MATWFRHLSVGLQWDCLLVNIIDTFSCTVHETRDNLKVKCVISNTIIHCQLIRLEVSTVALSFQTLFAKLTAILCILMLPIFWQSSLFSRNIVCHQNFSRLYSSTFSKAELSSRYSRWRQELQWVPVWGGVGVISAICSGTFCATKITHLTFKSDTVTVHYI